MTSTSPVVRRGSGTCSASPDGEQPGQILLAVESEHCVLDIQLGEMPERYWWKSTASPFGGFAATRSVTCETTRRDREPSLEQFSARDQAGRGIQRTGETARHPRTVPCAHCAIWTGENF